MAEGSTQIVEMTLADEAETRTAARNLAGQLRPGDVIALEGTLGAGKTAMARALINALPGDVEDVPSPTFTLVQTYHRGMLEIWHVDLYRLEDPDEALELGLEDAFADAVTLIEWPGNLGPYLPKRSLHVNLAATANEGERIMTMSGDTAWKARLSAFQNREATP